MTDYACPQYAATHHEDCDVLLFPIGRIPEPFPHGDGCSGTDPGAHRLRHRAAAERRDEPGAKPAAGRTRCGCGGLCAGRSWICAGQVPAGAGVDGGSQVCRRSQPGRGVQCRCRAGQRQGQAGCRPGPDPEQVAGEHPLAPGRRTAGGPTAADGTGGTGTGARVIDGGTRAGHAGTLGVGPVRARRHAARLECQYPGRPAMKRLGNMLAAVALALAMTGAAHARQDDIDISRLTGSLDQLSNDPTLGHYALSEQARARDAITRLTQAGRRERPHALYLAERRVDLAKTAAQLQDAEVKLNQLDREHDQIQLANSQREADMARLELARQRLQNQLAQEEAARLQQQGLEYSQAADQARAAAESKVARAARREAALAAQAAKAMRAQMEDGSAAPAPAPVEKKKPTEKHHDQH